MRGTSSLRVRVAVVALVLLLLVVVAVIVRSLLEGDSVIDGREVEAAAAPPLRRRTTPDSPASDQQRDAAATTPPTGARVVDVHVRVTPAGAAVAWRIDVVAAGDGRRAQAVVASESHTGDQDLDGIEIPDRGVLIEVVTEQAAGGGSYRISPEDSQPGTLEFALRAWSQVRGVVRARGGGAVPGARVLAVASARRREPRSDFAPAPRGADAGATAVTDSDGRFRIDRLDPDCVYDAAATRPGFAVARALGVNVAPGGAADLDFELRPGARLVGRLVDAAAQPLVDHGLRLARAEEVDGGTGHRWQDEGAARSEADGRFAFDCLEAGWKKLETYTSEPGACVVGFWDVRVAEGETRDLGTLTVGAGEIAARVVSDAGEPVAVSGRLTLLPDGGGEETRPAAVHIIPIRSGDDGALVVRGLARGRVSVKLYGEPGPTPTTVRRDTTIEFEYDGGVLRQEWRLRPWEESTEPPQAPLRAIALPSSFAGAAFLLLDGGRLRGGGTCPSGGATLNLPVGETQRLIVIRAGRYADISLGPEFDPASLATQRFDRDGRRLVVTVADADRGVPGARVVVYDAPDGRGGSAGVGATDNDGHFVLDGVPHDVELFAAAFVLGGRTAVAAPVWNGADGEVRIEAQSR